MDWVYFYGTTLILSGLITGFLRQYALKTSLMDIPNHRSSHQLPTPRGGGISFVLCFLVTALYLAYLGWLPFSQSVAIIGGGFLIATIGLIDDCASLGAIWRLGAHFFICIFSLYCLGNGPELMLGNWVIQSGFFLNVFSVFYLVWLLNLYNFMDGIDGIASVEAISVCLSIALLYYLYGESMTCILPLSLAVGVIGFLAWNFPPARIFMGDVGSGFLGFVLGILSIQSTSISPSFFWSWLILLGVFIVDATLTLITRRVLGQRVFEAHCTHAYQHASRYYGSHRVVILWVCAINLIWLLPWAFLVSRQVIDGLTGLLIAYLPLLILAVRFKAGKSAGYS